MGYESGILRLLKEQMIENWHLDKPDMSLKAFFDWDYPLVRLPSVINTKDGEYRFAALNSKNYTSHNEHYVLDTGKCDPKEDDNWWLGGPATAAKDINSNYMQIKQWGPEADNVNHIIPDNAICHPEASFDDICLKDSTKGNPYGDFGWWTQNNGAKCSDKSGNAREYCESIESIPRTTTTTTATTTTSIYPT